MSIIEHIKEEISIEDCLVHFGVDVPARSSDPLMVRCPWHEDRSPSMAIYRSQGRAWCYACNKGGDVLDVTALSLGRDINDAVAYWVRRLGLSDYQHTYQDTARTCQIREARRYREACRYLRRKVEQYMPRPHDPELLSLWDACYEAKDAIDERYWHGGGPENKEQAMAYLKELRAWRARWDELLLGANGAAHGVRAFNHQRYQPIPPAPATNMRRQRTIKKLNVY